MVYYMIGPIVNPEYSALTTISDILAMVMARVKPIGTNSSDGCESPCFNFSED
jgi:hypothetical protein